VKDNYFSLCTQNILSKISNMNILYLNHAI
jgi:hypothetical protein